MNKRSFLGTLVALLVITLRQQGEYLPLECWETDAHQLSWKSGHLGAALCPETPDVQRPQKTYPEPWLEQGQEPGWTWCFPWGGRACRFNGERGAVSEEMGAPSWVSTGASFVQVTARVARDRSAACANGPGFTESDEAMTVYIR